MKSVMNNSFAYLMGNFMADGSLYFSGNSPRFEFVDGSPYEEELKYSLEHLNKIKKILEDFLDKDLPKIVKRNNKYILRFRDKRLVELFKIKFGLFFGKKYFLVDIPSVYSGSKYECSFWKGYLDGDGSIARKFRKVSVESVSDKILDSFAKYLRSKNILFSKYRSKRGEFFSNVIVIRNVSFKDFGKKIGFDHPLKSKIMCEKMKGRDFYLTNDIKVDVSPNSFIDYVGFFDDSVFVLNGKRLMIKHGYKGFLKENVRFNELISFLCSNGLSNEEISKEIVEFRMKKGKGSINSIRLPLYFNKDLSKVSKFVRIRMGSISFSKRYINSFGEDFKEILGLTENLFGIKPKFTCKNEPLFCSGVLSDFFNKIIKSTNY